MIFIDLFDGFTIAPVKRDIMPEIMRENGKRCPPRTASHHSDFFARYVQALAPRRPAPINGDDCSSSGQRERGAILKDERSP